MVCYYYYFFFLGGGGGGAISRLNEVVTHRKVLKEVIGDASRYIFNYYFLSLFLVKTLPDERRVNSLAQDWEL